MQKAGQTGRQRAQLLPLKDGNKTAATLRVIRAFLFRYISLASLEAFNELFSISLKDTTFNEWRDCEIRCSGGTAPIAPPRALAFLQKVDDGPSVEPFPLSSRRRGQEQSPGVPPSDQEEYWLPRQPMVHPQ
ncbi:uncharacterized protein IAS62_001563 [Cryptococcus decagattii]|uniref:Uncharacterized protein n=1 Tax=Cryptococcus decagattii TaxID=1859122 RepID=A0ABZ2AP13_9TREE